MGLSAGFRKFPADTCSVLRAGTCPLVSVPNVLCCLQIFLSLFRPVLQSLLSSGLLAVAGCSSAERCTLM